MKRITISGHARERMAGRGASEAEVESALRTGSWEAAQGSRFQARATSLFGRESPVNGRIYAFKTVHVVFADDPEELVVISVLVYYGNREPPQ